MTGTALRINFFVYFKNKICRLIFFSAIVFSILIVYLTANILSQLDKETGVYNFMSSSAIIVNFVVAMLILFLAYFFQSLDTQNRFDELRKNLPLSNFTVIFGRLITILILSATVWLVYACMVGMVLSRYGYGSILLYINDYVLIPQTANLLYIVIVTLLSFYIKNWIWGFLQLFFCNVSAFFNTMWLLPSSFAIQSINPINTLNLFPDTELVEVPIFYLISPIISCLVILILWIYEKRVN